MIRTSKLAACGLYLTLYLAADLAAASHLHGAIPIFPWNAAPAISFGFAVRFGKHWLPMVLAAPLLASLVDGTLLTAPLSVLGQCLAETAMSALAVYFLAGADRQRHDLLRLRGVFVFLAVAAGASAIASGICLLGTFFEHAPSFWTLATLGNERFLAYLVAILSVAPFFLVHKLPKPIWRIGIPLTGEVILQTGALVIIAWEVFGRFVNAEIHFFYLLFLPFAWIATRQGQLGASLALAGIYVAPVLTDLLFGHQDRMIVELQIRLGVLAVTSLLFGAMVAERRQAEARMMERQTELAHFQRLNVGWEMASALAHELNQPLTAAMNLSQAALRLLKAPTLDLEKTASVLGMSIDRIERVGQIIHGLRDFMRKGELTLSKISLADVVADALRLVQGEIKPAGIAMQTSGLLSLPPVLADKTQIVQVLVNLLRNAAQSLTLAKTAEPQIAISGRVDAGMIEISVADNGPGLAPDVLNRLFEPFVTTKPAGMGLGLSISKSILEAHEGRLWAENAALGGAIFRFTLPMAERETNDA
jgi:signal transduction histidine kinase